MTTRTLFALPATLALGLASFSTLAQTSTPASVGVTPQTAEKANEKAIQRNDTGTVVRTASPVNERITASPVTKASSSLAPRDAASGSVPARPPRADRG